MQRYRNLYMSSLIGHVLKYSDIAGVTPSGVSWCSEVTSLYFASL